MERDHSAYRLLSHAESCCLLIFMCPAVSASWCCRFSSQHWSYCVLCVCWAGNKSEDHEVSAARLKEAGVFLSGGFVWRHKDYSEEALFIVRVCVLVINCRCNSSEVIERYVASSTVSVVRKKEHYLLPTMTHHLPPEVVVMCSWGKAKTKLSTILEWLELKPLVRESISGLRKLIGNYFLAKL